MALFLVLVLGQGMNLSGLLWDFHVNVFELRFRWDVGMALDCGGVLRCVLTYDGVSSS